MKGRFEEYNQKEEQAKELKKIFQSKKMFLIARQFGNNDNKETKTLSNLTAIIITLIELEDKYGHAKIKQLDSIMDKLTDLSPIFYKVTNEIEETNALFSECKNSISKMVKFGLDPSNELSKRQLYSFKIKSLRKEQERIMFKELK